MTGESPFWEITILLSLCDSCSWVPEVFRPANLNLNFLIAVYKISTGPKGGICDLFIPVWQAGSDFLIADWRNVLHFIAFSYANLGPEYINIGRLITRLSLHIYIKSSEEIEEVVGGQAGSGGDCHRSESLISQVFSTVWYTIHFMLVCLWNSEIGEGSAASNGYLGDYTMSVGKYMIKITLEMNSLFIKTLVLTLEWR